MKHFVSYVYYLLLPLYYQIIIKIYHCSYEKERYISVWSATSPMEILISTVTWDHLSRGGKFHADCVEPKMLPSCTISVCLVLGYQKPSGPVVLTALRCKMFEGAVIGCSITHLAFTTFLLYLQSRKGTLVSLRSVLVTRRRCCYPSVSSKGDEFQAKSPSRVKR